MRTRGSYAQLLQGKTLSMLDILPTAKQVGVDKYGRLRSVPERPCPTCGTIFYGYGKPENHCENPQCVENFRQKKKEMKEKAIIRRIEWENNRRTQKFVKRINTVQCKNCTVCGRIFTRTACRGGTCSQTCASTF